ncbi:hypothetical protein HWC08_gp102 [Lactobacillus phage 521B]|uniref:Uncharacterized protein n=1 Tax=Lactobacillus phage 521B TaxID=2510942 RepID=A0A4Y5FEI3_9CAUD|nr:hypothetical protein HWC08_gp102 [Lactobacillus phage 521B]QBJ03452.1 hypothetical protein B521_0102 [Lactobacillus phage 521B]
MSRSYRKNPVLKGNHSSHMCKKMASRATRRKINRGDYDDLLPQNSEYRRIYYDSWEIYDYASRYSISEANKYINKTYSEYKNNGFSPVIHKSYTKRYYYTPDGKPYFYTLNDMLNNTKRRTDLTVKTKTYHYTHYIFKEDTFEEFVRNTWIDYKKTWMCK